MVVKRGKEPSVDVTTLSLRAWVFTKKNKIGSLVSKIDLDAVDK